MISLNRFNGIEEILMINIHHPFDDKLVLLWAFLLDLYSPTYSCHFMNVWLADCPAEKEKGYCGLLNLFISNACAVRATYSFLYVVHGLSQSLRFLPRDCMLGERDWVFISY